ncbi:MAG: hypothetical protein ABSG68_13635 [Thermoguttaceae bacterium]|jgi:hypothetical protein
MNLCRHKFSTKGDEEFTTEPRKKPGKPGRQTQEFSLNVGPRKSALKLDGHGYSPTILHRILHIASVSGALDHGQESQTAAKGGNKLLFIRVGSVFHPGLP